MTLFQKFSDNMDALDTIFSVAPKIAVAVSGGGDSLSLTLLMNEWVHARGGDIVALTVDHDLRSESRQEAEQVAKFLKSKNIQHHILTWAGDKPDTGIQESARHARYELLINYCIEHGYTYLAVGHQAEDQTETFWMRLSHGSGLKGLSCMSSVRHTSQGVDIIRPLLNIERQELRDYCTSQNVAWIDDPSNENDRFLRVRLREFENVLAKEGLTTNRLTQVIEKLSDANDALQYTIDEKRNECIKIFETGHAVLKTNIWKTYPLYIRRSILSDVMQMIAPQKYGVGFSALDRLMDDILSGDFTGATLAHCDISILRDGDVLICKENASVTGVTKMGADKIWDDRFYIRMGDMTGIGTSVTIGALGEAGFYALRKKVAEELPKDHPIFTLSPKVCYTLPAMMEGENILAVPHLSYIAPDQDVDMGTVDFDFHVSAEKIV